MDVNDLLKQWSIAVTGGIACGKSTIAAIIRQQGYIALDADALSRQVVAEGTEGLQEVVRQFGSDILDAAGLMDRQKMRQLVFSNPDNRQALEAIIHPRLQAEVIKELDARLFFSKPRIWFYEASLIYERNRAKDFKQVWVAYCPVAMQIQRVMLRDQCSKQMAESILAAQMPAKEKADQADLVIHTDCSADELRQQVQKALLGL